MPNLRMGVVLSLWASVAVASAPVEAELKRLQGEYRRGEVLSRELTEVLGVSLSPLLGMGAVGCWRWVSHRSDPGERPWTERPWFFAPLLALTFILRLGSKVPLIKRFFKGLAVFESKLSALLFLPLTSVALSSVEGREAMGALLLDAVVPSAWAAEAMAGSPGGFTEAVGAVALSALGFTVWLAGHSVRVLCVLSPFEAVDLLLKSVKATLIIALVSADAISPWLGLSLAALYALVALAMAGWSFRLAVFGAIFCLDVFRITGRSAGASPYLAFASRLPGVPRRTVGRLSKEGEEVVFEWRPWLVRPTRRVVVRDASAVERGLVHPVLLDAQRNVLVRFPPRYRGASATLAGSLGLPVEEPPVLRGWRAARAWLSEQFSRVRRPAAPPASA
ncbi:MAG: hypothetical protein IAE78_29560 [Myxococcus sp.]|nr:hypothetical protein [Myxococcus sp.]